MPDWASCSSHIPGTGINYALTQYTYNESTNICLSSQILKNHPWWILQTSLPKIIIEHFQRGSKSVFLTSWCLHFKTHWFIGSFKVFRYIGNYQKKKKLWSLHLSVFQPLCGTRHVYKSVLMRGSYKCLSTVLHGVSTMWDSIILQSLSLGLPRASGNNRRKDKGNFQME